MALLVPIGSRANDAVADPRADFKKLQATGDVLAGQKQWTQALASYKQWVAAEPGSGLALAKLGYVESHLHMPTAAAHFKHAVELAPVDSEVWGLWAQARKEDNDIKGEIECRNAQLAKMPQTEKMSHARSDCLIYRSDAYLRLRQNSLAYKDLDEAIKISPKSPNVWVQRAIIRTVFGNDFPGALSDVNHAIALDPHNAGFLHHRGNIYWHFGHAQEAIKDIQAASARAPNDLELRTCLEDLKLVTGKNPDPAAAVKYCTEALVARPDLDQLYFRRADAYLHLNEPNKAIADAEKAILLAPDKVDQLEDLARQLAAHDLNQALKLINDALAHHPQFAPLLLARARLYKDHGHLAEAEKDFDAAVKVDPKDPSLWTARSFFYSDQARYDKALDNVNHALALRPNEPGFLIHRANLLYLLGDKTNSVAAYKQALDSQPSNVDFRIVYMKSKLDSLKPGDVNELKKLLTEARKTSPKNAGYSYWLAEILEHEHDYRGAAAFMVQGFETDNKSMPDFNAHIQILLNNKQTDLALASLSQEIKLHPQMSALYGLRAEINYKHQKFDDAKRDIQSALKIDPKNVNAISVRGDMKRDLLDYDGALSDYSECVTIDPNDHWARRDRAVINKESGRSKEALADFQYIEEHCPEMHRDAIINLAECESELHNYATAEQLFRDSIKQDNPTIRSRALLELAKMFQAQKRYKDAIEIFQQINREHPNNTAIYERCARCYMELHDWNKAVESMSVTIKGEPKDAGFYCERAEDYMQLHDYKQAIADYTSAIQYGHEQAPKYMRMRADAYEKSGQKDLANKDRRDASNIIRDLMN